MTRHLSLLMLLPLLTLGCVHPRVPEMVPHPSGSCRSNTLQWISPGDPLERTRLESWCDGVGPAVRYSAASQLSAVSGATPIQLEDVAFVTWNLHVGNGDLAAFVRDLYAGALTDGRPVQHFVLMLQEAVREGDVPPYSVAASAARRIGIRRGTTSSIVDVARELDLSLIYVPSMRNGILADKPADRGSAILTTLPLSEPLAVELPGERQRRVAIFARIALPLIGAPALSVGTVHLDALGSPRRLWVFGTPRMREMQARSLEPVLPEGDVVLGADLNTWHGSAEPAARYLAQLLGGSSASHMEARVGRRMLDYIFFRGSGRDRARFKVIRNDYGSDHQPILGWISQ